MSSRLSVPLLLALACQDTRVVPLQTEPVATIQSHTTGAQVRKILQVGTIKGQPGKYATFSYEIRRPFFGHLDIVMNYDKTVQLAGGKTD